jgi:hypothetical protein
MDGAARLRHLRVLQAFLKAVRRRRTWQDTDRLLTLLGSIVDPELRLHRFAEHLRARPPAEAAWTIACLWSRLKMGEGLAQRVCLGLLDSGRLIRVLGADAVKGIYAVLKEDDEPSAVLFAPAKARRDLQDDDTAPRPTEPVGMRISLARRPIPRVVERLLFDPDVRVVRTILGNARLTETDVVKLASSRRASPEILGAVAEDDRWIARYPVKIALANNPATPLGMVLGLLPYLLNRDLRELANASSRAEVREQAATLLSSRPGS